MLFIDQLVRSKATCSFNSNIKKGTKIMQLANRSSFCRYCTITFCIISRVQLVGMGDANTTIACLFTNLKRAVVLGFNRDE